MGITPNTKDYGGQKFAYCGHFVTIRGSLGGDITDQNVNGYYITRDNIDNLFVANPFDDRVQKFTIECVLVLKFGSSAAANSPFNIFHSVELDLLGLVYVTDMFNRRVHVFASAIP